MSAVCRRHPFHLLMIAAKVYRLKFQSIRVIQEIVSMIA